MVTSCLFLRYNPSTLPKKSLKHWKSTNASSRIWDFLLFQSSKWQLLMTAIKLTRKDQICKYFACYIICNYFKTLRPNWLSLYLNFCSLSSTNPLLASVWRSNFYSESQNHMLAMHIIAHFFPIFWKFPEAVIMKTVRRVMWTLEVEVDEVDEKR